MNHTPIIANMCNGCVHVANRIDQDTELEFKICEIHRNPYKLVCVENNEQCTDYHEGR